MPEVIFMHVGKLYCITILSNVVDIIQYYFQVLLFVIRKLMTEGFDLKSTEIKHFINNNQNEFNSTLQNVKKFK